MEWMIHRLCSFIHRLRRGKSSLHVFGAGHFGRSSYRHGLSLERQHIYLHVCVITHAHNKRVLFCLIAWTPPFTVMDSQLQEPPRTSHYLLQGAGFAPIVQAAGLLPVVLHNEWHTALKPFHGKQFNVLQLFLSFLFPTRVTVSRVVLSIFCLPDLLQLTVDAKWTSSFECLWR